MSQNDNGLPKASPIEKASQRGPAPKNPAEYQSWLMAWLATETDPLMIDRRYRAEVNLRRLCGIAEGQERKYSGLVGARLYDLQKGK